MVDAIARPVEAFPGAGGLRFFDALTMATGGCAVNVAVALAKLGGGKESGKEGGGSGGADVVARVGADVLGDFVAGELHKWGVSTRLLIRDSERGTSFSFVAVGKGGERSFLHTVGANARLRNEDVPAEELRTHSFVFVAGAMLMEGLDGEPTARLLRDAMEAGAVTLLDTVFVEGVTREEWRRRVWPGLAFCDYFIPSEAEARALTGRGSGESSVAEAAAMAAEFVGAGARSVVIKLGERGAYWRDAAGREGVAPAFKVERVVDATGAGDCWAAGFVMGLREGRGMEEAVRLGNAVAACGVGAAGATAGVVGREDVRRRWGV